MTQDHEVFGYSSNRANAELALAEQKLATAGERTRPSTALYWQEEIARLTELRDAMLVLEDAHGTTGRQTLHQLVSEHRVQTTAAWVWMTMAVLSEPAVDWPPSQQAADD